MHGRVRKNHVIREHQKEEPHLNCKAHQVACHGRHGNDQTRKINLSKNICIVDERFARLVQTFGKILPKANSRQIEQRLRKSVGTDLCNPAENNHEHNRRHNRLDKEPKRSKDCLLIPRHNVAFDEHTVQIAVLPEFVKVDAQQTRFRFDDGCPVWLYIAHDEKIIKDNAGF